MLDLAPETESAMREYAAREGVSADVFTRRLLSAYSQQQRHVRPQAEREAQPAPDFAASGKTEEAVNKYGGAHLLEQVNAARAQQDAQLTAVFAYINAPKEEIARLHAPDLAYLQAQLKEAEQATPEEIAQADAEWEEHKRRMNAHRAVTGEQPLFADVAPA